MTAVPCFPDDSASTRTTAGPRTIPEYCSALQDEVETSDFHSTKREFVTRGCRTQDRNWIQRVIIPYLFIPRELKTMNY